LTRARHATTGVSIIEYAFARRFILAEVGTCHAAIADATPGDNTMAARSLESGHLHAAIVVDV
jgi:hypothetical protein